MFRKEELKWSVRPADNRLAFLPVPLLVISRNFKCDQFGSD